MKFVRKLSREVSEWQERQIITSAQAEQILSLYPGDRRADNYIMIVIFSIMGALLIGGGIILILARNWDELPRWTRSLIAFLPLLASQIAAAVTLYRNISGEAWKEGIGLFYAIAIYACIALITQIYQTPGSFNGYLLLCSLLVLPVCYVLRANVAMLVYLTGITVWAATYEPYGGAGDYGLLYFIALLLAAMPHLYLRVKTNAYMAYSLLLMWCLVLCGLVLVVTKLSASHYFVVVSLYFSALYLLAAGSRVSEKPWLLPCKAAGLSGQLIMLLLLSYGNSHEFLNWMAFISVFSIPQLTIIGIMTLFCLYMMAKAFDINKPFASMQDILTGSVFILAFFIQAANTGDYYSSSINWGFYLLVNLYALSLGVLHVINGLAEAKFATACLGTVFISSLIIIRFFDTFVDFLARGLAFIAIGALFLAANLLLSRKIKAPAERG